MSKFVFVMVAIVATMFSINAFAWDPPASPAPQSWISDTSSVLSPAAHQRLDTKLKQINQSSANEVAALILPTLDGQDISDVTNATFKAWGVGKKNLDNGVLVVLAMKEHKTRIETGKGVEGDLPDLKTQDILQQARPWLRKGDVEGALGFIFDTSASSIANHKAELAHPQAVSSGSNRTASCDVATPGTSSDNTWIWLVLGAGGVAALVFLFFRSSQRKEEARRQQEQLEERLAATRRENERAARLAKERAAAAEREAHRVAEEAHLQTEHNQMHISTPFVAVPAMPAPKVIHRRTIAPHPVAPVAVVAPVVAGVVAGAARAEALEEQRATQRREAEARRERERQEEEDRRERQARAREREDEERRARERREQDEADRRRRDAESSSSYSSSSSSSSDSGSSWGGGGGDSGGFGGGDSGGGGSSSDW